MLSKFDAKPRSVVRTAFGVPKMRCSLHGLAILSLLMLPACAATFPSLYQIEAEDDVVAPQPEYEDTYATDSPEIVAEQISEEETEVSQLLPVEKASGFQFESIDETDPCVWAQQKDLQCSAMELPSAADASASVLSAEMRLKMSGQTAPDALAFDAEQTVDEIGRGRPASVAAQAIAEEFLTAPDPIPELPEPHPDLQTLPDSSVAIQQNE